MLYLCLNVPVVLTEPFKTGVYIVQVKAAGNLLVSRFCF